MSIRSSASSKKDYSKQKDCETALFVDGALTQESELVALGIVLSLPPLRAPVLAQHTLNYLFTTKPSDRASYFKALLEVTDLDEFRSEVAALEGPLAPADAPLLRKFEKAKAIPSVNLHFLLTDATDQADLTKAFRAGSETLLKESNLPVSQVLRARANSRLG